MEELKTNKTKFLNLVTSFPSLKNCEALQHPSDKASIYFDAARFQSWILINGNYSQKIIAQFVLTIWNFHTVWGIGVFNFWEACKILKMEDRKLIAKWVIKPFYIEDPEITGLL